MACWLLVSRWRPLSVQACHVYLLLNKLSRQHHSFMPSLWTVFDIPFTEQIGVQEPVWKSRWTSWAPVPNKPTVSVDVKQHFNQLNKLSRRHQFYAVSVNSFRYTFYWTNYLDDTSFMLSLWTVFDIPFTEQIISTTPVLRRLCELFSTHLLLNKLSRRHQFYAVSVNSFRYTFYWTNYLDDTSFTPSL